MIRLYLNDKDIFKAKLPKEQVNRIVRIDKENAKARGLQAVYILCLKW